jgi:serine/threonine protein kinase
LKHVAALPALLLLQASEGVRDIMHRMLNPNPNERITVPEIMAHPWFCTDLPAGVTELNETLLATAAAAEVDDYDASCSLGAEVRSGELSLAPEACASLHHRPLRHLPALRCCCHLDTGSSQAHLC